MPNYCTCSSQWWERTNRGNEFCTQCQAIVCPYCGAHFVETGVGMDTGDSQYGPPCDCANNGASLMAFEPEIDWENVDVI